jgi:hypothetical protein
MKMNMRISSIIVMAYISLASTAAMAAETLTVSPAALNQSAVDTRFFDARIRVAFSSFFGVGKITQGGGFTASCPSSPTSTPLVSNQIHDDPLFPMAVRELSLYIGTGPYDIPGFDAPTWGHSQICRLVYKGAVNYSNFPLNFSINIFNATISINSQQVETRRR